MIGESVSSAETKRGSEKSRQTGTDSKMERNYGAGKDPLGRRLECSQC